MILHWDQLPLHYGPELDAHRSHFEEAGQTTFGLLCCRFSPSDDRLGYSDGAHAEERLLTSDIWSREIPQAFEGWMPGGSPIVVTMALNRSPCRVCAARLVQALGALQRRFPLRCEQNRFLLACRGVYEAGSAAQSTSFNDLRRLHAAGWQLCVLQTGARLSNRGQILLDSLVRIVGRGYVRLG